MGGGTDRWAADEVLQQVAGIVEVTDLPVSADLEHGFGDGPDTVAETVRLALDCGLAGCSIEDATGRSETPIYEVALAAERMAAAAEAAHAGPVHLVLTGRAENLLHGIVDLGDTVGRLQAYQEAGADVLYAPGLTDLEDIRRLVASVDRPVNALARPGGPTVGQLAEAGVARVSVGGAFCFAGRRGGPGGHRVPRGGDVRVLRTVSGRRRGGTRRIRRVRVVPAATVVAALRAAGGVELR